MSNTPDVIIVGAGIAGLTAAAELSQAGFFVTILEARDRIGGRIFTQRDSIHQAPIELGAEFIHGHPPEIWKLLKQSKIKTAEVKGDMWCTRDGKLSPCNFFSAVDKILDAMDDRQPDESFRNFLESHFRHKKMGAKQREAREHALEYVSGFNAADPALVSVHWLVQEMCADEAIEGDRAFRAANGYSDLIEIFQKQLAKRGVTIQTGTVVERIHWQANRAKVFVRDDAGKRTLTSPRVLITLPLAVLKARPGDIGAVQFDPPLPGEKLRAMKRLEMGKVIRIALRFQDRFWARIRPQGGQSKTLSRMSFLFSQDAWFPTWWTTMPAKLPIIVGWAPFRCAEKLSGQSREFVIQRSLESLANVLSIDLRELQDLLDGAFFHDWQTDPFSRGAYSYAKVGADGAQGALGRPLDNTLFFAGEATDTSGHNGTVHGAMASGYRAAAQIRQSATQRPIARIVKA